MFTPVQAPLSNNQITQLIENRGIISNKWDLPDYRKAVRKHLGDLLSGNKKERSKEVINIAKCLPDMVEKEGLPTTTNAGHLCFAPKLKKHHKCYFKECFRNHYRLGNRLAGIRELFGNPNLGSYATIEKYPKDDLSNQINNAIYNRNDVK